jgi:hypothetical protein
MLPTVITLSKKIKSWLINRRIKSVFLEQMPIRNKHLDNKKHRPFDRDRPWPLKIDDL